MTPHKLGEVLKTLRKGMDESLTPEQVSQQTGVKDVEGIEAGTVDPRVSELEALLEYYDCSLTDFSRMVEGEE